MSYAPIPMIPGPVTVPERILRNLSHDYGSGQVDQDFLALYHATSRKLAKIMETDNDVTIMTGEGMLALWSALKSCLRPGERVLSIVTGVFGDGIGDMAASIGCDVRKVSFPYNESALDIERIGQAIAEHRPEMITLVHCETPSGTLNPVHEIGALKKEYNVPLLYVDAVSSIGGVPVYADDWNVDLLLGGSQKCLSMPPSLSFLSVSQTAWEKAEVVQYQGYDALAPWRSIMTDGRCPYTPYWNGVACAHTAAEMLLEEGLATVFSRHEDVATRCRNGLQALGIELWPASQAIASPTVTAALVPQGWSWPDWQKALRQKGLCVAGSFGEMEGRVFRLGHMGSQANMVLMDSALDAIASALKQ